MRKQTLFSAILMNSWPLILCMISFPVVFSQQQTVNIGAMFQTNEDFSRLAFETAIQMVNEHTGGIQFVPVVYSIDNALDASIKACDILESGNNSKSQDEANSGIAALFVIADSASVDIAMSLCELVGIPIMQVASDSRDVEKAEGEKRDEFTLHIHPSNQLLSKALIHFAQKFEWKTIVVLYSGRGGILQSKSTLNTGFLEIGVENILFWPMESIEKTLKDLRHSVIYKHIIVDIETELIEKFLRVAYEMKMMSSYHHYMFTSLDLATITVDRKYTSGGVNITGFRLVHTDSPKSQYVLDFLKSQNKSEETGTNLLLTTNALIIDSINLLAAAINNLRTDDKDFRTFPIDCNLTDTRWSYGSALVKEISELSFAGLTGTINIKNGRRADFDLELVEFDIEGNIQTVGNWDASKGLNISTSAKRRRDEILRDLNNKTLDVVVKPEAPFIMPTGENSTKFYGYAMDMLEYLAKELNFSYNIIKVPDETSGRQLSNGSWTGMIGMLIRNEADIALGDLTINHERSRVIDFTKPFMTLGISILYKKPEKKGLVFFSFMEPLNNRIWLCVIAAYIGVSLFCFFIARFSPYQWRNPHPCNPETDLIENEFTLLNSFWFTIASLMQQGSEVTPRAISTRLVAGFWHLFTLILISSYTANLAAFLTINRMSTPIQNAEDLAKQTAIKYGCQYGESTYRFFQVAQMSTYEKMWNSMSQNPNVFVNKSDLGIAKVKAGNYAYLMESIPLRYQLSQHCDLMEVGDELDSKGYGIGLPKNSPFRDMLSERVLYLSENQILIRLYNKWWKKPEETCKSQSAEDFTSSTSANQLGLDNLGGVFVILGGGLVLAIIIGTLEFCINAFVNSKSDRRSMCAELVAECQFAAKCWVPVNKPVQLVPSNLTSMGIGQSDNEVEMCNLICTEHS